MPIGTGGDNFDSGNLFVPRWTDKSFPTTQTKIGANTKPDFDFTDLGLLFPQNNTSEVIYILDQMLHTKKLGTPLRLHIHFRQTSALLPNFKVSYRFYNNGDAIPAFTTLQTDDGAGPVYTYAGTPFINLIRFPEIPAPVGERVSAILDMKIFRDDNRVVGDVLTKYIDYHFQVDGDGSRTEFSK